MSSRKRLCRVGYYKIIINCDFGTELWSLRRLIRLKSYENTVGILAGRKATAKSKNWNVTVTMVIWMSKINGGFGDGLPNEI